MTALDQAAGNIGRAEKGTGEAIKLVYYVIRACQRHGSAVANAGLDNAATPLLLGARQLESEVHARLARADGNAIQAIARLDAIKDADESEVIMSGLRTTVQQLSDMRTVAAVTEKQISDAIGTISRVGGRAEKVVEMLGQAQKQLKEVVGHCTTAVSETEAAMAAADVEI